MMDYFISLFLLAFVAVNLLVAISIFLKSKKDLTNSTFCFFVFLMNLWVFCNVFMDYSETDETALIFARITVLVNSLAPAFFFYFISSYKRKRDRLAWIIFIPSLFFSSYSFSSAIVEGANTNTYPVSLEYGWLYPFLGIYITLVFLVSLVLAFTRFIRSEGLLKKQLRFLVLGFLITIGTGLITNLLLPAYGCFDLVKLGPATIVVYTSLSTYSMVKYQFLGVRSVFKKLLAGIISFLIFLLFVYFCVWQFISSFVDNNLNFQKFFAFIFLIFIFVIAYYFLLQFSKNIINAHIFTSVRDQENIFKKALVVLNGVTKINELVKLLERYFLKAFEVQSVKVFQTDDSFDDYLGRTLRNSVLEKSLVFFNDQRDFNKHGVSVITDLRFGKEHVGFLVLGKREYGELYTKEEVSLLKAISSEVAATLKRIKLFSDVHDLNANLEKKVEKQTSRIANSNRKLRDLLDDKTFLTHMVSHQIRGPIINVMNYLSLLRSQENLAETVSRNKYFDRVMNSAKKLHKTSHDLLLFISSDGERLSKEYKQISFLELCREMILENQKRFEEKKLRIFFKVEGSDFIFCGYKILIKEALKNLFENACYYSDPGKVSISLSENSNEIEFIIQNPVSLKEKKAGFLNKVYSYFTRGNDAKKVNPGGTGLGIPIVKRIIEKGGGRFEVIIKDRSFISKINVKK